MLRNHFRNVKKAHTLIEHIDVTLSAQNCNLCVIFEIDDIKRFRIFKRSSNKKKEQNNFSAIKDNLFQVSFVWQKYKHFTVTKYRQN